MTHDYTESITTQADDVLLLKYALDIRKMTSTGHPGAWIRFDLDTDPSSLSFCDCDFDLMVLFKHRQRVSRSCRA